VQIHPHLCPKSRIRIPPLRCSPDGDRRPALPCSAATRLVLAAAAREGAEEARRRRRGDFFFLLRDILDDYSALLYLTLETHDLLLTVGSGDRTVLREEPIGRPIALLPRESLLPHKARPDRGSDPTADDAPTSSSPPPPSRSRGCGGLAVHRGWRSPPPPPTATPHPGAGLRTTRKVSIRLFSRCVFVTQTLDFIFSPFQFQPMFLQ
jgi:hypothetical protein